VTIASKFLNWLYKRSPHNAADPNPSAMPYDQDVNDIPFNESQIIEMSIEQDVIIGLPLSFGDEDTVARGPNRELIRSHKKNSILCGCGHIAPQSPSANEQGKISGRKIIGKCFHCDNDGNKMLQKGLISPLEAARQSLVCNECARLVSGVICCPKHYVAASDENGNIVYLGPDEQTQQKRKDTIQKILMPFAALFTKQNQPQLPPPSDVNE
jgi:hypothetical protein